MTPTGDWDEIIDEMEAKRFIGREQELDVFRRQISLSKPNYLIFYVTGQGGVGKSTLLNRYKEVARDSNFLIADCDEQERDVPSVLGRFARQLAEQDMPLKRFNERYKTYRQKMNEIESDPEAPQGLASMLGRTLVRATFAVGDMVPGVRKGLEIVPQDVLETQASEWTSYLAKKLTNKDDISLIKDPVPILTALFFSELNECTEKRKVLLCFENFEVTRQELQDWLLRLREYKPSLNIRIAIAGRDLPGAKWDALRNVTTVVRLDVFTEQEAEAFLDICGIKNVKRRIEILECSGRLPVIMSWLAAPEADEPDASLPAHNIVERFLRWITEPTLRQVALLGAMPRTFNADILKFMLENQDHITDAQSAFDWLLTMPFVHQTSDGWRYHDVVRSMMLYYQRQKSPQSYRRLHLALAAFYTNRLQELGCTDAERWFNEEWRKNTLAHSYHFLVADSVQHWANVMSLFVISIRKRRSFATELTEMLNMSDVQGELSAEQHAFVLLFYQQLQSIREKNLLAGLEMFDRLCNVTGLSDEAKGYAFTYRGECYRLNGKWEDALRDFDKALGYIPDDVRAITRRSVTYVLMSRYQDALADLGHAIALDEKDVWAIAIRGETYRRMGQYQEALADLDRAVDLDEKNAWVIAIRGETYRRMGRYQDALDDLNRALTLDEKETWAIAIRGEIYRRMGRYEEALTDLSRAIALDGKDIWSVINRGEAYYSLGRYEEALADLNRAIALDEKQARFLATRGQLHLLAKRSSIKLNDPDAWKVENRSPYSPSLSAAPAPPMPAQPSGVPGPDMPVIGSWPSSTESDPSETKYKYSYPEAPMPYIGTPVAYPSPNPFTSTGSLPSGASMPEMPAPPMPEMPQGSYVQSTPPLRSRRRGIVIVLPLILLVLIIITVFLLVHFH
ncbi:MAG TPA: tetratricopeptide repeat protein [Ktedonobacteraceae bacterium]|nr:tetratricopeptide repeat protein [Ktedonobacteraceae bacterium]